MQGCLHMTYSTCSQPVSPPAICLPQQLVNHALHRLELAPRISILGSQMLQHTFLGA